MSRFVVLCTFLVLLIVPNFGHAAFFRKPDCTGVVTVGDHTWLNIRERASTTAPVVGTLKEGDIVTLTGRIPGERVEGTTVWFAVGEGLISGAFLRMIDPKPFWCDNLGF